MSTTYYLTLVTVAGVQSYIFNSNRLAENIGASYLVKQATEGWCFEALRGITTRHNLDEQNQIEDKAIEQDALDVEVLYAGGGNIYLLFQTQELAQRFAGALSRQALKEAPGLRLFISTRAVNWTTEQLCLAIRELNHQSKEKRSRINLTPSLAGLGVTVMCQSTSLPAVRRHEGRPVSSEVFAKLQAAKEAHEDLQNTFQLNDGFEYTRSFDNLGAQKELASLLGVVHADGDGIGRLFSDIGKINTSPDQNREYVQAMRAMSANLKNASTAAMRRTIQALQGRVEEDGVIKVEGVSRTKIELSRQDGKFILPMRPLVFGGDDVTFVCDGRLALALTVAYQRAFEEEIKKATGQTLTACAGVAIVKVKYPFARAYLLAEELTKSAKRFKKQAKLEVSCLDWHLAFTGLHGDLSDILEREYRVKTGSLRLRPVSLASNDLRTWQTITTLLKVFQRDEWLDKRNKMKALRDALRGGPQEVEHFCTQYEQTLPMHDEFPNGWQKSENQSQDDKVLCGLFDALEIADLYVALEKE